MSEKNRKEKTETTQDFIRVQKKAGVFRKVGGYFKGQAETLFAKKEIAKNATYIKGLSKGLIAQKQGRTEQFFEAVERMRLEPAQVLKNHQNFVLIFLIASFFILMSIIFGLYAAYKGNLSNVVNALGALMVFIAIASTNSFRAFQIRKMRLCDFSEWLSSTSYWIPKKIDEKKWTEHWNKMLRNKKLKSIELMG